MYLECPELLLVRRSSWCGLSTRCELGALVVVAIGSLEVLVVLEVRSSTRWCTCFKLRRCTLSTQCTWRSTWQSRCNIGAPLLYLDYTLCSERTWSSTWSTRRCTTWSAQSTWCHGALIGVWYNWSPPRHSTSCTWSSRRTWRQQCEASLGVCACWNE